MAQGGESGLFLQTNIAQGAQGNRRERDQAAQRILNRAVTRPSIFFDIFHQLQARTTEPSEQPSKEICKHVLTQFSPEKVVELASKQNGKVNADEFSILILNVDIEDQKSEVGTLSDALLEGYFRQPAEIYKKDPTREGFAKATIQALSHAKSFAEALIHIDKTAETEEQKQKVKKALLLWADKYAAGEAGKPAIGDFLKHASHSSIIEQKIRTHTYATNLLLYSLCRLAAQDPHIFEGRIHANSFPLPAITRVTPLDVDIASQLDVQVRGIEQGIFMPLMQRNNAARFATWISPTLSDPYEQMVYEIYLQERSADYRNHIMYLNRTEVQPMVQTIHRASGCWGMIMYAKEKETEIAGELDNPVLQWIQTLPRDSTVTFPMVDMIFQEVLPTIGSLEKGRYPLESLRAEAVSGPTSLSARGKVMRFGHTKEIPLRQAGVTSLTVKYAEKNKVCTYLQESKGDVLVPSQEQVQRLPATQLFYSECVIFNNRIAVVFDNEGNFAVPSEVEKIPALTYWIKRIALGYIAVIRNPSEPIERVFEPQQTHSTSLNPKRGRVFLGRDTSLHVLHIGHKPTISPETEAGVTKHFTKIGHRALNDLFIRCQSDRGILNELQQSDSDLYNLLNKLLLRIALRTQVGIYRHDPTQTKTREETTPVYQLSFVGAIEQPLETPPVEISCPTAVQLILRAD